MSQEKYLSARSPGNGITKVRLARCAGTTALGQSPVVRRANSRSGSSPRDICAAGRRDETSTNRLLPSLLRRKINEQDV
jgi:hypothetical protein